MDKIQDSDSCDKGSIPFKGAIYNFFILILQYQFFYCLHMRNKAFNDLNALHFFWSAYANKRQCIF